MIISGCISNFVSKRREVCARGSAQYMDTQLLLVYSQRPPSVRSRLLVRFSPLCVHVFWVGVRGRGRAASDAWRAGHPVCPHGRRRIRECRGLQPPSKPIPQQVYSEG